MDKKFKQFFLSLLYSLVRLKRRVFGVGSWIGAQLKRLNRAYERSLGTSLYALGYRIGKHLNVFRLIRELGILEFFGRRSTLQIALFSAVFIVMIPHTKLYSQNATVIPGRKTLLYALVGPGDQDFAEEEIIVEEAVPLLVTEPEHLWRDGFVSSDQAPKDKDRLAQGPTDISNNTALGGTAITKPTIFPGSELPIVPGDTKEGIRKTGRTQLVEYLVKPGDTLGGISEKFDISLATLLWANNLNTRSYIRPGQTLQIMPVSGVLHTVARGETVSKIANTYNTDAGKIVAFNKLQKDGADIIIGEKLIIPDGKKPTPKRTYTAPSRTFTALRNVAAPPPSVSAPAGSGYLWPTNVRTITQYYGWRHTGLDIAGPVGSPLYASRGGTVTKSKCGWNGGYGCMIILDHGGGVTTLYGHASQLYVSVGENVVQGQTIAAMGSTGRSTGSHIHFEIRVSGRRGNPLQYIR